MIESKKPASENTYPLLMSDFRNGLSQLMFYLGRDVAYPTGNLLLEAGFTRLAKTQLLGTSRYQKELHDGSRIELHGSSICWLSATPPSIVYLRPTNRLAAWDSSDFFPFEGKNHPALRTTNSVNLYKSARNLAQWWLAHELWIRERVGAKYRINCAKQFAKLPKPHIWLPPGEDTNWLASFIVAPENTPRAQQKSKKITRGSLNSYRR